MKITLEKHMENPVRQWLEPRGYIVHRQSALFGCGIPDLLGYNVVWDIFAVVELKMRDYHKAISQATTYREFCHLSYIAFPADRAAKVVKKYFNQLSSEGIGILAVGPEKVTCLLNAVINTECKWAINKYEIQEYEGLYKRFRREIRQRQKGDKP